MSLETFSLLLLHVAAVCQTLFVLMWAMLPWHREWIGRALMVKSATFALLLDSSLAARYMGGRLLDERVGVGLFALVTVGIVSQAVVLGYEMVKARRATNTGRGPKLRVSSSS